jgi:hypothetical protein
MNNTKGFATVAGDLNEPKTPKMSERPLKTLQDFPTSKLNSKRPNLARLSESAVSFQIGFSRPWEDLRWHLGPG